VGSVRASAADHVRRGSIVRGRDDRAGPIPSAVRTDPFCRRGGRPARPPSHSGHLFYGPATHLGGVGGKSEPGGRVVADLRSVCAVRLLTGFFSARGERPRSDAGAAHIAASRDRDQLAGNAVGQHPRAGPRRLALCGIANCRLRGMRRAVCRCRRVCPADPGENPAAVRARPVAGSPNPGRTELFMGQQTGLGRHLARPVRRVARRCHRVAAGIRTRHLGSRP
jgi:hypothetical protein